MGWVPLPRSFPISWYCKLDTGMQKPKLHPELQMQQMLQVDLLLRPANSTSLVPTWHGAPSQVNHISQKGTPKQPPTKIYNTVPKVIKTQDPGTTRPEGNSTHLKTHRRSSPRKFVKHVFKANTIDRPLRIRFLTS